jgi:hypothetical protein
MINIFLSGALSVFFAVALIIFSLRTLSQFSQMKQLKGYNLTIEATRRELRNNFLASTVMLILLVINVMLFVTALKETAPPL